MNKNFLRIGDLAKELSISKTTLWRWRNQGKLPKPISLSGRVIGWRRATVEKWLDEQSPTLPNQTF